MTDGRNDTTNVGQGLRASGRSATVWRSVLYEFDALWRLFETLFLEVLQRSPNLHVYRRDSDLLACCSMPASGCTSCDEAM